VSTVLHSLTPCALTAVVMLSSSIPRGLDDSTSERSALVVIEDAKGGQPAKVTDMKMAKLIDLTKKSDTEKSTEAILQIVQEEAPNLLSGLAMSNNRAIARSIEVRAYLNDEVVFRQNDAPDAYYTVLRGAVSIYALQSSATEENGDEEDNRKEYGKFLVQLKSGAGFGELSFQGDYNHTPRNAGIVSDGMGLMESSVTFEEKPGDKIGEGGNVCILLLIPEECYMREMYALHASKNKTKEKINFLKKSFLFSTWSMDQLVKLAYAIKKRDFEKGGLLAKQGDRADNIFMVIKGKIRVQISSESHLTGEKRIKLQEGRI
jgi:CRP-like cAMP-binding protein